MEPEQLPEIGFIRIKQVLRVIPVSKSAWWDGVKTGIYPKPHKLSRGVTAWDVEDIRDYIKRIKQ